MARKNASVIIDNTPYDDVFRTMMVDCRQLLIPVINEIFGKNYSGKEKILFSQNEHFLNRKGGKTQKRITDSAFDIIGEKEDSYIFECQSTADNTLVIRIFEYSAQDALDKGVLVQNKLKVKIPKAAVLFLRSNSNTPDKLEIELETPGGTVRFDIPVMKMRDYSIDTIFEKNYFFWFLLFRFYMKKDFLCVKRMLVNLNR